ncbi:MAG: rhomboid family intramembrane serine protease [Bacteroidales bacterium]|nr:rhomboid family intramembrane serine protease [Bacteroidales bacterium]
MNIDFFKKQNIIIKLIAINGLIFILLNIIKVIFHLTVVQPTPELREIAVNIKLNNVLEFISVPATMHNLLFKFWTPLTYMFVQVDFFHILGNMLWLYFMGSILIQHLKETDFLALYFVGGIAGAIVYIISFNLFPIFSDEKIYSILLGASASVTAIVIAIATLKPNEVVYFFGIIKIKLVYLAAFLIIYDIFLLKGDNAGGHFAHIGGAIYGFFYAQQFKKGNNITGWLADFIGRIFGMEKSVSQKRKFKVVKNSLKTKDDYQYNKTIQDINKEIDRILEKISRFGYQHLSRSEKEFLKKNGKSYK